MIGAQNLIISVTLTIVAIAGARANGAAYTVTDLGKLTEVRGINASGEVVGDIWTAPNQYRAFLFANGKMHELGILGGSSSFATSINATGQVVGSYSTRGQQLGKMPVVRGFLFSKGVMQDLGTIDNVPGGGFLTVEGINDLGHLVGVGINRTGTFIYSDGQVTPVASLSEKVSVTARHINASGQVVGTATFSDHREHAFLFSKGKIVDVGTFGGKYSSAYDINNAGYVVGQAKAADGHNHAFLYFDGKLRDLGVPEGFEDGQARGINAAGQIVGSGSTITGWSKEPLGPIYVNSHAFLYEQGKWIDLNSRVHLAGTGLNALYDAEAINDSGQIIGKAMAADSYHAFLLTPVSP